MMRIMVNGEERDVLADATVLGLLEELGLNPKTVVVQHNEEIVERNTFGEVMVLEGDRLELVRFVGGG